MTSRRAWTDFADRQHVQPALFDPAPLARAQPKRRRPGSIKKPVILERDIQKVILQALSLHPLVARIERINVMAGRLIGRDGKPSRFMRSCRRGRVDLDGISCDGRVIAIEVKKPSERHKVTDEQRAYLDQVAAVGGISGVACSVEDALAIVEGRM